MLRFCVLEEPLEGTEMFSVKESAVMVFSVEIIWVHSSQGS